MFVSEEIHSCLKMLSLLHYESQARELQKQFDTLLVYIDKSIAQIWDPTQDLATQAANVSLGS